MWPLEREGDTLEIAMKAETVYTRWPRTHAVTVDCVPHPSFPVQRPVVATAFSNEPPNLTQMLFHNRRCLSMENKEELGRRS